MWSQEFCNLWGFQKVRCLEFLNVYQHFEASTYEKFYNAWAFDEEPFNLHQAFRCDSPIFLLTALMQFHQSWHFALKCIKAVCIWVGRERNRAELISRSNTFGFHMKFSRTHYLNWKSARLAFLTNKIKSKQLWLKPAMPWMQTFLVLHHEDLIKWHCRCPSNYGWNGSCNWWRILPVAYVIVLYSNVACFVGIRALSNQAKYVACKGEGNQVDWYKVMIGVFSVLHVCLHTCLYMMSTSAISLSHARARTHTHTHTHTHEETK